MAFRSVYFYMFFQLFMLSTHAQESTHQNDSCTTEAKVKRKSNAEAHSADSLKIICTVEYCNEKPDVEWCQVAEASDGCNTVNKTDLMEIQWTDKEEKTGILSLHFKNISMTDSGLYRCRCVGASGGCVSHSINVRVKDASQHGNTDKPTWLWPAIYISSGVASVLTITALSCVGIKCYRGSQQAWRKKADENQYASVQMSNIDASPPDSHHPVQRQSRPSSQPTPATAQSQEECVYENGSGVRSRPVSNVSSGNVVPPANHAVVLPWAADGETGPLVYASLNHQVMTQLNPRPVKVKEDSTEYAAIRLV